MDVVLEAGGDAALVPTTEGLVGRMDDRRDALLGLVMVDREILALAAGPKTIRLWLAVAELSRRDPTAAEGGAFSLRVGKTADGRLRFFSLLTGPMLDSRRDAVAEAGRAAAIFMGVGTGGFIPDGLVGGPMLVIPGRMLDIETDVRRLFSREG